MAKEGWPIYDMNDTNVFEVTLTREDVRGYFDGNVLGDSFDTALDSAQGEAQRASPQFVVIRIDR